MDRITETLITITIGNFCRVSGIGRSKTYELLSTGALDSLKIGKRRLIILDSYRKLIEQQRSAGPSAATRTPTGAAPAGPIEPAALRRGRGRPRKIVGPISTARDGTPQPSPAANSIRTVAEPG